MVTTDTEFPVQAYNQHSQSLLSKWNIPVSHLDYKYLETCQNGKEIERITRILRSGEEGSYPELLKYAEDRLTQIKPDSKYLQRTAPVLTKNTCDAEEWKTTCEDIEKWQNEVKSVDESLHSKRNITFQSNHLPEIRKVAVKETEKPKQPNNNRIKSWDYKAWDKYDPDLEDLKEELAEEVRKKASLQKKKAEQLVSERKKVSFNVVDSLTETEAIIMANRAREKGNEYFKSNDYEEAKKYYSNSLKLFPTVAAFNNRCITNFKLKMYQEALIDCHKVLEIEPENIKALLRKGQICDAMGNFDDAYNALKQLIGTDPNNTAAQSLMNRVMKKVPAIHNFSKHRLTITEIDDNDEIPQQSNQNQINKVVNKFQDNNPTHRKAKKVIVPIPSTSSFTGPNIKIIEINETPSPTKSERNKDKADQELPEPFTSKQTNSKQTLIDKNSDKIKKSGEGIIIEHTEVPTVIHNALDRSDDNTIKKPTKIDLASCGEPSPILPEDRTEITSPYEFTRLWQSIKDKNDLHSRANVLRRIPSEYLLRVIGSKLDAPMLSAFLNCLQFHFQVASDAHFVETFLTEIIHVDRFDLVAMFMGVEEKSAIRNLIAFLNQHGITLPENVLCAYSL